MPETLKKGSSRGEGLSYTQKEGEVRLKNNKSKKEKDDSDFGEYVDYEDVDEK